MVHSGVYRLDWGNGYFYIGQSVNIIKRWRTHRTGFKRGSMARHQLKLFNVWTKHGEPKLTIIINSPKEHLDYIEQLCIDVNWGNPLFCNTSPSSVNSRGIKRTKPSWQTGKKFTEEHRMNLSKSNRDKIGIINSNHKLSEKQVLEIREKYIPFSNGSVKLAKEYGVSYMTILYIVKNCRYANLPLSDDRYKDILNNKGAKLHTYKNISQTLRKWSTFLNINHGTLESRLLKRSGRREYGEEAFDIIDHTITNNIPNRVIVN